MNNVNRIYIAGHHGMVGSALIRALEKQGHCSILKSDRCDLDLLRQKEVEDWFEKHKPDLAIIAAAKVGGIHANSTYPAEYIYENLMIATNCIHAAYKSGVKQLLFLGSSCIYPKASPQPMPENCLLSRPLELSNEAYAIAKIAGLKLCQYYRKQYGTLFHSVMPTNLYGPGDNYHPENSHVIPGLIRRFHEAKINQAPEVIVWGTGTPRREFLHVDDLADACLHLLKSENPPDWINIGSGVDITILELAETLRDVIGYQGALKFDATKPDGTARKLMDTSLIRNLGWEPRIPLREGLCKTYQAFLANY